MRMRASTAKITAQHVCGDEFNHRIVSRERRHPFAAAGMKHFALAAREVDNHAGTALDALHRGIAAISEQSLSDESRIVVGEESIVEGEVDALFFERR